MQAIWQLLKILDNQKTKEVVLFYDTYRQFFSMFDVPPTDEIYDKNNILVSVKVDRIAAINWLMKKYNFIRQSELTQRIQEEYRGS